MNVGGGWRETEGGVGGMMGGAGRAICWGPAVVVVMRLIDCGSHLLPV